MDYAGDADRGSDRRRGHGARADIDDIETEPTETFGMVLSNPEAGYIADQATTTVGIIDDECSFELTIASVEAPG